MGAMASQITGLTIVYSTIYLGADQRKHQGSTSLAFDKWPITRIMFPFDDVIMYEVIRSGSNDQVDYGKMKMVLITIISMMTDN